MLKRVKIEDYKIGLVYKNGLLNKVIETGQYWVLENREVKIYDLTKPFISVIDPDILMKNELLAGQLELIRVKDNQIVLVFDNSNLKEVLTTGKYLFWKQYLTYQFTTVDLCTVNIGDDISHTILDHPKLQPFVRKQIVSVFEKGLLYIDNKMETELTSGTYYFWINSTPVEIKTMDTRVQQLEISGQELLTKDKASIRMSIFVRFQMVDIVKALCNVKDYDKQLYVAGQLALREIVSSLTLDELLTKKDILGNDVIDVMLKKTNTLGVLLFDAGLRDVILPGDMKEIMNQVLVAEKKAQANIIMRREETASVRSMLNTAKLMEENEMLWKLKEMEYVEKIADKIGEITISGKGGIVAELREIFTK